MRVIVVGGGIMGLSTAFALRNAGHRVALYEQGSIPNPHGSSVDQHRLIRHPYGPMTGYARLINPALAAWDRMWSGLGQRLMHQTGTLMLARDDLSWVEDSLRDADALGIEHQRLTPSALTDRAPMLRADGVELAAWVNSGGVLMARDIVAALGTHLLMNGVTVNTNTPVVDIDPVRGSIVLEDGSRARADAVVVAAGPWVRSLFPPAVGRVKPSRQVVMYLEPPQAHKAAWANAPMVLDIHGAGGIYAVPPVAGTGLKIGDHSFSMKGHPDRNRGVKEGEVNALFEACRSRIKDLDEYTIASATSCFYTVQKEERFVLEPIEKAVLMTGFSGHGFKFGALMGELASGLIAGRIEPNEATALAAGEVGNLTEIDSITNRCLG